MNTKQRTILIVATFLFLISELIPPWQYEYTYLTFTQTCPANYSFITRPPNNPSYSLLQARCLTSDPIESVKTQKDMTRLNGQRIILALLSVGLFLGLSNRPTKLLVIIAAIILVMGLFLLVGYIALLYFTYV